MAAKICSILALSLLACLVPPSASLISKTYYFGKPEFLSSVYIRTVDGGISPCCSAALVSQFRALTSCFCVNLCLQSVRSRQGKFYGGTVNYGIGMYSLDPTDFATAVANGSVYTQELDYADIKCPGTDMTDTKFFRNDLAVIEIGTVDVDALNFIPIPVATSDPDSMMENCFLQTWSSSDCQSRGILRRNYAQAYIEECSATKLKIQTPDGVGCMRFNASVLLTKGDMGADLAYTPDEVKYIQFGVASWQRQTEPFGYGCTRRKEAQPYTKLSAYTPWLMMTAPFATYSTIAAF